jgi:hypothetical protein
MSDVLEDLREELDALGDRAEPTEADPEHDPTNGRWLEKKTAKAFGRWGYRTSRNECLFGLETDVVACRVNLQDEPADFLVAECKDWQTTLVGREAVADISHRALLARAMPVLVVAKGVTPQAWTLAQVLDVRILTYEDLYADSLPPLTERRPPRGTLRTRREPRVEALRSEVPSILRRPTARDVEAPVFFGSGNAPSYVPDREGNDTYIAARNADYDFNGSR